MHIINKTHWQTRDLRRIASRVVREELPKDRFAERAKRFKVYVGYNRGADWSTSCSGYAYYHSNYCYVNVPSGGVNPVDFAYVVAHEVGHCKGLRHGNFPPHSGHRTNYSRQHFAWAAALPIRKVLPKAKAKPTPGDKLAHAERMLRQAETRAKRAHTLLRKWRQKVRYYQRKAAPLAVAACRPPEQVNT